MNSKIIIYLGVGIIVIMVLSFTNCGLVESFKETQTQSNTASEQLEKELEKKPSIYLEINNTILTEVNVAFRSGELTNLTVGKIESKVRNAVLSNFKKQPNQITFSFILSVK
jgi:hypothetical protein